MHFFQRRIVTYIFMFIVMVNLIFILPRLVPGNAAQILASGSKVPVTQEKLLEARLGIDQPLYLQYALYLKNIFATWPPYFGVSFDYYPSTVTSLFLSRIGWTLILILSSFAISVLMAYVTATFSSLRRGGKFDFGSLYSAIALNSTPIFWIGMILLWTFAVALRWFPLFGSVGFNPGTGVNYALSIIWHSILPVVALSLSLYGESYILLRGSIQEVLKSDFVLAAKTRGLRDRIISQSYILRNSLLPLVSVLSFSVASLISRVVLVESVFGYPGLGDLIVDSVGGRDYPVLEGSLFYLTLMVIFGGLIGDLALLKLDPALRQE